MALVPDWVMCDVGIIITVYDVTVVLYKNSSKCVQMRLESHPRLAYLLCFFLALIRKSDHGVHVYCLLLLFNDTMLLICRLVALKSTETDLFDREKYKEVEVERIVRKTARIRKDKMEEGATRGLTGVPP